MPYGVERNTPKLTTWELANIDHDYVIDRAIQWLPYADERVARWMAPRFTMTDDWSPKSLSLPASVLKLLPQPGERNLYYLGQAVSEAEELVEASREGLSQEGLRLELGDILFFLMATNYSVFLTENPDKWLELYGFLNETRGEDLVHEKSAEESILSAVTRATREANRWFNTPSQDREGLHRLFGYSLETIVRYTIARKYDLVNVIDKTKIKNDWNYPDVFFNYRHAPFYNAIQAIRCLRLFRHTKTGEEDITLLGKFHRDFRGRDTWVGKDPKVLDPTELRLWVLSALHNLLAESRLGEEEVELIQELITVGNWTEKPFPYYFYQKK